MFFFKVLSIHIYFTDRQSYFSQLMMHNEVKAFIARCSSQYDDKVFNWNVYCYIFGYSRKVLKALPALTLHSHTRVPQFFPDSVFGLCPKQWEISNLIFFIYKRMKGPRCYQNPKASSEPVCQQKTKTRGPILKRQIGHYDFVFY